MDVLRDDLFKNKYFLIIVSILAVIIGVIYLVNSNSVESKCKRYVQNLGTMLGAGGSGLKDIQLQTASESLVQDCIKRGGPDSP